MSLSGFTVLACDGCFVGMPAVISFIILILALVGSIYVLLWSNLGARQAYLVTMVALSAWMILMSALWMFGAPGTTTATGPRGREAQWVAFKPTSEQGQLFTKEIQGFPASWDKVSGEKIYPGNIDPKGELEGVRLQIEEALARDAEKNELKATKASDWSFLPSDVEPATAEEEALPKAQAGYLYPDGGPLLFGVTIPAQKCGAGAPSGCKEHREVTVFAYRDKGLIFLYAFYSLAASIGLFIVHLMLLARYERKHKEDEARLAMPEAVMA